MSCPMNPQDVPTWFTDLWNHSIVPYILNAVREVIQVCRVVITLVHYLGNSPGLISKQNARLIVISYFQDAFVLVHL